MNDIAREPLELEPLASFDILQHLVAHDQEMMDNLSYIALDGLPADVRRDLEGGVMPIGHLLSRMWVRRSFLNASPMLYERLWGTAGLPDAEASRTYCIATPEALACLSRKPTAAGC